ncbi:hypothetical protein BDK88_0308 [Natrinema hispanicum]|uniref:Uncharacterized protein n=1 Tax=Natrinema hispanicum TaxID=392421 RepID=A0A482YEX1_9EURY|nr:hypothetical protein [Natrinema hispanicum]RZV11429.1 hypothetical protein BDK88_0308 [Natrinema hispanicum]
MTTDTDHDATTDVPTNEVDDLEQLDTPIGRATAITADALESGTLPLVGGGLMLGAAIRSLAANRPRAIPLGIAGGALVGLGLQNRRLSRENIPDIESETAGKEMSDEASAAADRVDAGRVSEVRPSGEIAAEPEIDETQDEESDVAFTEEPDDDKSRSRPDLGAAAKDPRRDTEDDEVAIDISDAAMADEESEATGPDPRQAQPTQTEDTEPDESPAADASHMTVAPPDADESESEPDDTDATDDESAERD